MKAIRKLIFSVLIVSMLSVFAPIKVLAASNTAAATQYKDVKGQWFEKWANTYGYSEIFSNGDNCFNPNQPISRMEFARLIHKALGININYFAATSITEYYNDVKNSDKGSNELYDLVTSGIIDTKGSFRPNEQLKRDEMIHFAVNAFYYIAGRDYAIADTGIKPFADDSDIKADYKSDIYRAVMLGLITGRDNNLLKPLEGASRAESVAVVGRLAELLNTLKKSVAVTASASEENGELILNLTIKNNSDKTIAIEHGYGQLFDFTAQDVSGKEIYRWSAGRMFPMMITTTKIEPGKETVFTDRIEAKTYSTIKDKLASVKAYIVGTSTDFKISSNGYFVSNILKKA